MIWPVNRALQPEAPHANDELRNEAKFHAGMGTALMVVASAVLRKTSSLSDWLDTCRISVP